MADNLSYIRTDYTAAKQALIERIRARYPLVWNDFLSNSLGIVLIDLVAWVTCTLAFLINRAASEVYIPTMTTLEAARRIGALTNYQLRGSLPATLKCEATLTSAASSDVSILKNTLIRVNDLPFEVSQDYTILAGKTSPETSVAILSSEATGSSVITSDAMVTGGSAYVDLVDTTVDLTQYVQVGQSFRSLPLNVSEQIYTIQSIESAPGAVSNNRLVISPVWSGSDTTTMIQAEVYDRRISLSQGQTITDQFITPSAEAPGYSLVLTSTPVIDNSTSVSINGESWSSTTALMTESSSAKVFQVKTISTGQVIVTFGDGVFGAMVPPSATVTVVYRIGGGLEGNVEIGSVNVSISGTSTGGLVVIPLRNDTAPGQGGRDPETLEEARVNIPYYTRTNDQAVTLDDYQTIAQQFSHPQYGSVAYARASVRTENALLEGNIVMIYAWTTGPSGTLIPLQPQLKSALVDYIQTKAVGTDYVMIADGTSFPVPLSLRFKIYTGYDLAQVTTVVADTIRKMITDLRPGSPLVYSDLVRKLDEVYGVDNVTMATPTSDLVAANPTQVFTPPDSDYLYTLDRTAGSLSNEYTCQMPASPLTAWAFKAYLGGVELAVLPDVTPGSAWLIGGDLLTSTKSTVNLLTGQVKFYTTSSATFAVKLVPVTGYDRERSINVYIGYTGDNSQSKRREIRAALREWIKNGAVGAPLYAGDPSRVATGYDMSGITSSKSNIAAVVKQISGVTTINRVALDTPANAELRLLAASGELLTLGSIVINNNID